MSADIVDGLEAFLRADAALFELVAERVYGLELPLKEAKHMPRKAVVLSASGGAGLFGGYIKHTAQRFDVISYGETPYETERVRRAAFDALKQLQRAVSANVLIHWCDSAGGFTNIRDADTKWPINFQSFQAFYAEQAA